MNKKYSALIISIIFCLISSYFLERIVSIDDFSLSKVSAKIENRKQKSEFVPIMGANEFSESANTLQSNQINLDMWHGHHHLIFPMNKTIEFDLELSTKSVVDLTLYNPEIFKYDVIRLDKTKNSINKINVRHDGKFLSNSGEHYNLENSYRVRYQENSLYLNDRKLLSTDSNRLFGIKLDNEEATAISHLAIGQKSIDLRPGYSLLYYFIAFAVVFSLVFFLRPMPQVSLALVILLISIASHYSYLNFFQQRYPSYDLSDQGVVVEKDDEVEFVQRESARTQKLISGNENGVFFLGSSQTFGEGASQKNKRWTKLVCERLQIKDCINLGIRSATSHTFVELNGKILKSNPKTIFYILAFNDGNPTEHMTNTKKLVKSWKQAGVEVVLVLEPNRDKSNYLHQNLANIGKLLNVKTIDMHKIFQRSSQQGWIWWDKIHLTDFGHQLFSDFLIESYRVP